MAAIGRAPPAIVADRTERQLWVGNGHRSADGRPRQNRVVRDLIIDFTLRGHTGIGQGSVDDWGGGGGRSGSLAGLRDTLISG
jgi:hypothetical protein